MRHQVTLHLPLVIFLTTLGCVSAYTTYIHAPAVLVSEDRGVLTSVSLNVTSGNGAVLIKGPVNVDYSTDKSAATAANYASSYLGLNERGYNFTYYINSTANVSGPSAGLAFTLLAVAGLEAKPLNSNFTATGTIGHNGSVGAIGGIYDKVGAAKNGGMSYVLVPAVQNGSFENLLYYVSQQEYALPLVEVANISQALPYAGTGGGVLVRTLTYNISKTYNLNISNASITCTNCNITTFGELENYTLNFTAAEAQTITSNFSGIKTAILAQLPIYRAIAGKGYLYTAADFAFLQYSNAFLFANVKNFTKGNAVDLIENVSSYCKGLMPPQLTSYNYEYVIGGEVRQTWANISLSNAQVFANNSESTDDILRGIDIAASSYAWCRAAGQLYSFASAMGGMPVDFSQQFREDAYHAISKARAYGDNLYIEGAMQDYNSSEYGAALYGATYADTFGNSSLGGGYSTSSLANLTIANAENSTFGIWPSQFANTALFYLHNAKDMANVTEAYTTSVLAIKLSGANRFISSSFAPYNATQSNIVQLLDNQTAILSNIENQVSDIYILLLIAFIIIFILAAILLVMLLRTTTSTSSAKRNTKGINTVSGKSHTL